MGFLYMVIEDFDFKDYYILKGVLILLVVWWFFYDFEVYVNFEFFDLFWYLFLRNEFDFGLEVFGFGCRMCFGCFFVDDGLYFNFVMIFVVLEIIKVVSENG